VKALCKIAINLNYLNASSQFAKFHYLLCLFLSFQTKHLGNHTNNCREFSYFIVFQIMSRYSFQIWQANLIFYTTFYVHLLQYIVSLYQYMWNIASKLCSEIKKHVTCSIIFLKIFCMSYNVNYTVEWNKPQMET
jgi:c-di-AMP phosphodiesterase-like protein